MYEPNIMPRDHYPDERRERRRDYPERPAYEADYDDRYHRDREEGRIREKVKERDRYSRETPPVKQHRDMAPVSREHSREVIREPTREYRDVQRAAEYAEYYEGDARMARQAKKHKHKKSKRKRKHSKDRELDPRRSLVDYEVISSDPDSEAFSRSPAVTGRLSPSNRRSPSPNTAMKDYKKVKRLPERSHSNSPALHRDSRHSSPLVRNSSRGRPPSPRTEPKPDKNYAEAPRAYRQSPTRPPSPKKSRIRSPSPYSRKKPASPNRSKHRSSRNSSPSPSSYRHRSSSRRRSSSPAPSKYTLNYSKTGLAAELLKNRKGREKLDEVGRKREEKKRLERQQQKQELERQQHHHQPQECRSDKNGESVIKHEDSSMSMSIDSARNSPATSSPFIASQTPQPPQPVQQQQQQQPTAQQQHHHHHIAHNIQQQQQQPVYSQPPRALTKLPMPPGCEGDEEEKRKKYRLTLPRP